jgi:hypothetical protein
MDPGVWEGFSDPAAVDPEWFVEEFLPKLMGSTSLITLFGLAFLYGTWWLLLAAFCDGGLFRCFWSRTREGKAFSTGDFLRDGARLMGPMVLLQFLLFLVFLAGCVPLLLVGFVGALVPALLGDSPGLAVLSAVLLGIPYLLVWLALGLLFISYTFTARACVAAGMRPWAALGRAWEASFAGSWRSLKGLTLTTFIYLAVSIPLSLFLNLLALIPILGILFTLSDFVLGTGLLLLFMVFTPGLAVHYLTEEGKEV